MAYTESYAGLGRVGFNPFRKGKKGVRGRKYLVAGAAVGALGYFGGKKAGLWGGASPAERGATISIPKRPLAGPPPAPKSLMPTGFLASLRQIGTQQLQSRYEPAPMGPIPVRQAAFLGMPMTQVVPLGIAAAALTGVLVIMRKKRANRTMFQKLTGSA